MNKFKNHMKRGEKSLMEVLVSREDDSDLYLVEGERISGIRHEPPSTANINEFRLNIDFRYELLDKNVATSIDHHEGHAYCMLGYRNKIDDYILVYDGYGPNGDYFDGTTLYRNKGNSELEKLISIPASHSLGTLYSASCGMLHPSPNPDRIAGKLMGASSYAEPDMSIVNSIDYEAQFSAKPIPLSKSSLTDDRLNYYFQYVKNMPHSSFKEQTKLAATTQEIFEKAFIVFINKILEKYDIKNLILTGGSALNCKATQKLFELNLIQNIFSYPLADDAGARLGAFMQKFGIIEIPKYNSYIHKLPYEELTQVTVDFVVKTLRTDGYIGWYEGGSEYGPRALCHRSLLALADEKSMHFTINQIKEREYWRPFAPVLIEEEFENFYGHKPYQPQEYMMMTDKMKEEHLSKYYSISSVDGTSRPQCLYRKDSPVLYDLMKKNGLPVLLNTSMNTSGRSVPETPQQAIAFSKTTGVRTFFCNTLGEIYTL